MMRVHLVADISGYTPSLSRESLKQLQKPGQLWAGFLTANYRESYNHLHMWCAALKQQGQPLQPMVPPA